MATNQNKKLIEQLFSEVISGKNLGLADKLIAPDYVNYGIPGSKTGPEGFKEIVQQFLTAFPDFKVYAETILAEDDGVATRGYWTGTNKGSFMGAPPTGKLVRVDYIDFWKIKNGKCTENWVQMDMPGLMEQLGLQPQTARR